MNEIKLSEAAYFTPGHCHICGGNEGPMIDTGVDVPGDGRTYICQRTCLPLIARACKWLTPTQADSLLEKLGDSMRAQIQMKDELDRTRPVIEAMKELGMIIPGDGPAKDWPADKPPPPPSPGPPPPLEPTEATEFCTATKKNGQPCTARSVPGWNLCVAHTRRAAAGMNTK